MPADVVSEDPAIWADNVRADIKAEFESELIENTGSAGANIRGAYRDTESLLLE
jgi:hypothetical protein